MIGYGTPIGGVTRQLDPFSWIHSCKFDLKGTSIGARMGVLKIPDTNKLVVWSSIPVGEDFDKVIAKVTNDKPEDFEVVAGIVPNLHHDMSALGLKQKYPNMKLIGPYGIKNKPDLKLDHEFQKEDANKVVEGSSIVPEMTNLQFLFLSGHKNHEIVTFDKNTERIFVADLVFNVPWNGVNEEQYPGETQNKGWKGYLTGMLSADYYLGRYFLRTLFPKKPWNSEATKLLLNWKFDSIVMCHGNVIEKGGKDVLRKLYEHYV